MGSSVDGEALNWLWVDRKGDAFTSLIPRFEAFPPTQSRCLQGLIAASWPVEASTHGWSAESRGPATWDRPMMSP